MDVYDRPVGYTWLIREFGLTAFPLSHESYIGARARSDATRPGLVREIFPPSYWPGDDPFDHLVFALKYDDFNLDILDQSLTALGSDRIRAHVETQPNGRYARQLGYLYELLSGEQLKVTVAIGGSYVNLLDPKKYIVAAISEKSTRWHINDNLLGSARFCPVVRRIAAIDGHRSSQPCFNAQSTTCISKKRVRPMTSSGKRRHLTASSVSSAPCATLARPAQRRFCPKLH